MRTHLRFLLAISSIFVFHLSYAQVTLISAHTNLSSGFVTPNGIPLLISDSGQLYTTNGTEASVLTTNVLTVSDSGSAAIYKNQFYFTGRSTSGDVELWATDGTSGNTRLVANVSSSGSSYPESFFVFNNTLYFTADDGVHGRELWKSDGSANNATLVADIDGASTSSFDDNLNNVSFFQNSGSVLFVAKNNNIKGLYNLTASGVTLVKNDFPGNINLGGFYLSAATIGNKTVFTVDTNKVVTNMTGGTVTTTDSSAIQVWATDGTTAGTQLLHNFVSNSIPAVGFITSVQFKGLLYFKYVDTTSSSIWTTDGTPGNTVVFKNFDADKSDSLILGLIYPSTIINNKLYFIGYSKEAGYELWNTDGIAANTAIFKDINPGYASSLPLFTIDFGNLTKYVLNNNIVFNFQQLITPFNGKFYFSANDGTHGIELWSTDGTAANTTLVKDINPGTGDGTNNFLSAYYTASGIYFAANNATTGIEPWVTDGTPAGTNLIKNLNPETIDPVSGDTTSVNNSNPNYLFIYNNQLYFNADDGTGGGATSLYKIDQTNSALPVTLLNFTASKQATSVLLNWTTTNEINTHHFTVERSLDGTHFNAIGTLAALGTITSKHGYQLTDATAMQTGSTILYYRLQSVNKDGSYSYSKVLTVPLQNGTFAFTLSPNPVRNQLTVSFSTGNAKSAVLRIADAGGKQLYQQAYSASSQSFIQQTISVAKLVAGTYFIQLITDKETKTLKFIKQ